MSAATSALRQVLFVTSVAVVLALPGAARAAGALDAYLPKSGKIEGHVMTFSVAPEDQAIDKRFRLAVQNNMDWFKKYVTSNKQGQPMPYNPKMGITEAQYTQLQHMKADFHPGDAVSIEVKKAADGSISFASTNDQAAGLAKVTFPAGETEADTPYGKLAIFNEIHQTDERAPIGVWSGAEWAQIGNDTGIPSAKIAFGKRDPSGEGVMYYQVAPMKDQKEQSLVVFYKMD